MEAGREESCRGGENCRRGEETAEGRGNCRREGELQKGGGTAEGEGGNAERGPVLLPAFLTLNAWTITVTVKIKPKSSNFETKIGRPGSEPRENPNLHALSDQDEPRRRYITTKARTHAEIFMPGGLNTTHPGAAHVAEIFMKIFFASPSQWPLSKYCDYGLYVALVQR